MVNPDRQTVVSADNSSYGLGAVIMQWEVNQLFAIVFASRTLTDAERRYAQIEKECPASVLVCEKFAKYLIDLDIVLLMTSKHIRRAPGLCQ